MKRAEGYAKLTRGQAPQEGHAWRSTESRTAQTSGPQPQEAPPKGSVRLAELPDSARLKVHADGWCQRGVYIAEPKSTLWVWGCSRAQRSQTVPTGCCSNRFEMKPGKIAKPGHDSKAKEDVR